jgi:hypothetical protein
MIKSRLAAIGGAATLVFASVGHTAVVPFKQAATFVHPAGDLAYSSASESPASVQATNHFQLNGDAAWTDPARFVTFSTEPTWTGLGSISHANADKPATAGAGKSLAKWSKTDAQDKPIPLYAYLLSAGQYVLEIGTLPDQSTVANKISAVPLPGALWLFGSALLAFLGISSRRKF